MISGMQSIARCNYLPQYPIYLNEIIIFVTQYGNIAQVNLLTKLQKI